MRILLKALILNEVIQPVNKYGIQGFIYNRLQQTSFKALHQRPGFKFFCFSDIFPISEYHRGGKVNLIISSPWSRMIKDLSRAIERGDRYNWGGWRVQIQEQKTFDIPLRRTWITGSPILIRYDESGRGDNYFSIERGHSLQVFLQRLKQNSFKKYLAFHGEMPEFHAPLFEELVYDKAVAIQIWGARFSLRSTIEVLKQAEPIEPRGSLELLSFHPQSSKHSRHDSKRGSPRFFNS